MIYFVKRPDDGRIKIGTSLHLSRRLKQLAAEYGDGLVVLAVVDGDHRGEHGLHQRFAHLRTVGEWFEPGDDLVGFIVAEGREWDGMDEVPNGATIYIDSDLVTKAKFLASLKDVTLSEYLNDLARPPIERDFKRAGRELFTEWEGEPDS